MEQKGRSLCGSASRYHESKASGVRMVQEVLGGGEREGCSGERSSARSADPAAPPGR